MMIKRVMYIQPYSNYNSTCNTDDVVKSALAKLGIETNKSQIESCKLDEVDSFIEAGIEISRRSSKLFGIPTLVDLHGLCVNALNGRPGHFFSARSANAVMEVCKSVTDRRAYRYHLFVLAESPSSLRLILADSAQYGMLATSGPVNGYSSIFIPQGETVPESELPEEKQNAAFKRALNQLVHRLQYLT